MKVKFWSVLILLSLFSACGAPQPQTALPAGFIPTMTNAPVEATLTVTPSALEAPILTPYVPFYVASTVENLVLRANPGYLFEAKTILAPDTRLLVLGRAPGNEWIFVQTPFESTGWVFAQLLQAEQGYESAPLIQPADVQLVRGRVVDEDGGPISGIQFALVQGTSGSPPRNDATTDANGIFYAFMPLTASGTWSVSYTAIACISNIMDKDCKCLSGTCGKPAPEITGISLPSDELLSFMWN